MATKEKEMKDIILGEYAAYLSIKPNPNNTGTDNSDSYVVEISTDQHMLTGGKEANHIRFTVHGNWEIQELCRHFGNAGRRLQRQRRERHEALDVSDAFVVEDHTRILTPAGHIAHRSAAWCGG